MAYRKDIDGLRALAVLSVIAFHSGLDFTSGGYVGVDVFFVISGFIITNMIYREVKEKEFSYVGFYKRRAARLLPAFIITLLLVFAFGFYFYTTKSFDKLGKEIFFSSLGTANILFAQGVNYFAEGSAYQPLMHLWSLGVEEQFYLVWPTLLLVAFRISDGAVIPLTGIVLVITTSMVISATNDGNSKAYFLLQYRANELLIGSLTALLLAKYHKDKVKENYKRYLSYLGLSLMVAPVLLYDKNTAFPGYNALLPCIGVALIIAFPNRGLVTKMLSHGMLVLIGLISYPLYLYHQPFVSFARYFELDMPSYVMFITIASLSSLLAMPTYHYIEKPIRNIARSSSISSSATIIGLCLFIPVLAAIGFIVAKTNGLPERFKYLNQFALEVTEFHSSTFHDNYERGFNISNTEHGEILFVGDSVLQHYVLPFSIAIGLGSDEVDTVTRGGCVLLKGVEFNDKYADISCNDLRSSLYSSQKNYNYVVISQSWELYQDSVTNFPDGKRSYDRWTAFINQTVEHFLQYADEVIIIGAHPRVSGATSLQPSIRLTKESYLHGLRSLEIDNAASISLASNFFLDFENINGVTILEPHKIFCSPNCILSSDIWSYYSDSQHITSAATNFVVERIKHTLAIRTGER
ncbi:acyltransferase [Billgrantia diversa]|uniref:acyltransferase family protein n=1 Tax=Halomonas sp. MCCC 1A13316 TaxID=2733487 RepID=UPI0018A4E46E|nr:acyltransferase family protein [Halomonas sp. MCCC 1A13316]QOR39294.1 acyltransferase [Halomonas sp. MCCC 1A13316]